MNSSSLFQKLTDALHERVAIIANYELRERDPEAHLQQLKAASEQIANLQDQLPPDADPQLRHFLKNCSYQKALAFLESR